MSKSFTIETPDNTPDVKPPPVKDLAAGADKPQAQAPLDKKKSKGGPDTAGVDQFLKAQIGSDRYKEIAATTPKAEPGETDERGDDRPRSPDGKFLKAGDKPPKPAEKEPAPPSKAKEQAAKPAPFKPKPQPTVSQMTPEQVVAAAAEGAAKAIAASKPAGPGTEAKKPDEPQLPQDEQDKVEILSKMEAMNPTKYKGIADKYKKSLAALDTYAKEWEKEHPDVPFDEDSPEHEAFFKENDIDWSDLDFQKAVARIVAEDAVKPIEQKEEERSAETKREQELAKRQGEISAAQNTAAIHFWGELGDDLADVVNADGTLNMAKVNALKEADPEAFSINVTAAQALDEQVAEIFKLYAGLVKNDWEHNPIHRNVNQFAAMQEQKLASKPTQDRLNQDGKLFVPAAQWFKMTKAEREQHWTFSAGDISFLLAKDLAATTKKRIELVEEAHKRWAKARGIQLENPDAKPESPAAGGESRMAAVTDTTPKNDSTVHSRFLQTQLKGS